MKVTDVVGEAGRFWVQSDSNPEQRHLVDLLEHECGCPSFTCRNRAYKEKYGHNMTCKHIDAARNHFTDEVLEAMREHILSK